MENARTDRRRASLVGVAAAIVLGVLVLASSAQEVRVWTTPEKDAPRPQAIGEGGSADRDTVVTAPEPDAISLPGWLGDVLDAVAVVLVVVMIGALVLALLQVRPSPPLERVRRRWHLFRDDPEPLPQISPRPIDVDVEAARAALSHGPPRNAIVGCWMQLEDDATAAGLPRMAAETSSEYVERVVASSSVDPAPIAELASLYREARFSRHELDDRLRDRAVAALDGVEAALATSAAADR